MINKLILLCDICIIDCNYLIFNWVDQMRFGLSHAYVLQTLVLQNYNNEI